MLTFSKWWATYILVGVNYVTISMHTHILKPNELHLNNFFFSLAFLFTEIYIWYFSTNTHSSVFSINTHSSVFSTNTHTPLCFLTRSHFHANTTSKLYAKTIRNKLVLFCSTLVFIFLCACNCGFLNILFPWPIKFNYVGLICCRGSVSTPTWGSSNHGSRSFPVYGP